MKILGIDIETAPNTAHVWGLYNQNVGLNQILQTGRVMCFAWRWYHLEADESPTEFIAEWTGGNTTKRRHKKMVRTAHRLLTEADVVVHYNGTRFDMPTLNREFLKLGLTPPAPYQQVDLLRVAKRKFRFASNRMDHLLHELGIGSKVRHEGHEMWVGCMNGDRDHQEHMETYNVGDVDRMEELYAALLPWISTHPNHALYKRAPGPVCPNCGGDHLQRRGYQYTKTQKYQRYHCQDCGSWCRSRFTSVPRHHSRNTLTQAGS